MQMDMSEILSYLDACLLTCLKGSQLLAGLAGLEGFLSRSRAEMMASP